MEIEILLREIWSHGADPGFLYQRIAEIRGEKNGGRSSNLALAPPPPQLRNCFQASGAKHLGAERHLKL